MLNAFVYLLCQKLCQHNRLKPTYYDDDSFDVAISLLVTCNLSPKVYAKHFEELKRVLVPGGKAVLLLPTDWSYSKLYTRIEADPAIVEDEITEIQETVYPETLQLPKPLKLSRMLMILL